MFDSDKLKRWALSITAAVIAALVIAFCFGTFINWVSVLFVVVTTTVLSIGVNYMMDRLDTSYSKRIEAKEKITWNVLMNGVNVGTVSDVQYAIMQQRSFRDGRNAIAQVLNLVRTVFCIIEKLIIAIPLSLFWGVVAFAISSPDSLSSALHDFKADPASIITSVGSFIHIVLTLMFIAVGIMFFIGYRFGFKNYYSAAVGRMLRQHCNTPADGDLTLYRAARGDVVAQGI